MKNENNSDELLEKKKNRRRFSGVKYVGILAFFLALYLGMLTALLPFFRPSYSESEKRKLTSFPKLTVQSLFSGDFFDGVSLWYSDTFPAREKLLGLNNLFRQNKLGGNTRLYGNTNEETDVIPEEIPDPVEPERQEKPIEDELAPQPFPNVNPNSVETVGVLLVVDDTAYELYNFNKECANKYVGALNRLEKQLGSQATVYNMIVPTSIGVMVSDDLLKKYNVNSSDQHKAINYIYESLSKNIKTANPYKLLEAHRSEYLYFRTDHHWTANGAYYAYTELMKQTGRTPFPLDHYSEVVYDGFLGTFYSGTKMDPQLKKNPDTIHAYKPQDVETFESVYLSGKKKVHRDSTPIIQNVERMSANNKYLTFMGGDRVWEIVRNPNITDGSVCTVVKDSFANCLIPFLVDHYAKIYVVDPREFTKVDNRTLAEFVAETGSKEVFMLNNVSATRTKAYINSLLKLIG